MEEGQKAFLVLPSLQAVVARVRINGQEAGAIAWAPYEVEITPFISTGPNAVEIELVTSLRNLLGPHHRPSGEPDQVWGDGWTGASPPGRRDTKLVSGPDWHEHRDDADVFWTDDYFLVPFGQTGEVVVEVRGRQG